MLGYTKLLELLLDNEANINAAKSVSTPCVRWVHKYRTRAGVCCWGRGQTAFLCPVDTMCIVFAAVIGRVAPYSPDKVAAAGSRQCQHFNYLMAA